MTDTPADHDVAASPGTEENPLEARSDSAPEIPTPLSDSDLSEEEQALLGGGADPGAATRPTTGLRALVAGNHQRDVSELREAMERRGFEVVCVADYREAVLALSEERFDLVTVSIAASSPGALGVVRELASRDNVGTLLLATRQPTPSLVFQAARAGADYVVVMPPSASALDRVTQLTETRLAA